MINHARSYPFSGQNHNLTRTHQGWGFPDVARMYDMRDMTFVLNEEVVLQNLQTATFEFDVPAQTPEFRATMVYLDLMGNVAANIDRINDLSLRVVSPTGTEYWGNNGLSSGNFSTPNGVANTVDTVENVFVQNPAAGTWLVQVIASEINEDSHLETPVVDADFALVVSGVNTTQPPTAPDSFNIVNGSLNAGSLGDLTESDDSYMTFLPEVVDDLNEPAVWVVFNGTLPSDSPSSLSVNIESAVNTVGLTQTIELFNFNSQQFEQVDSRDGSFDVDEVVTIDLTGNIANYVQPGTGNIQTRVGWRATGPTLFYPWTVRLDQLFWQ
jgi:hypothetical protein